MPGTGLDIGNIVLNETKSLIWWLLISRGKKIYFFFKTDNVSILVVILHYGFAR